MPPDDNQDLSPNTQTPSNVVVEVEPAKSKPILGYWNVQARGDAIRMLLHNLGVDFEDKQYIFGDKTPRQSWDFRKDKLGMTFPNLPYWKDGDKIISETVPIIRAICRKYAPRYLGLNQKAQAYADTYSNTIYGNFDSWFVPYMFADVYKSKRVEGREQGLDYLEIVEKCLGYKRFIASNDITYADFVTYGVLKTLMLYDEKMVNAFPKLIQYMQLFANQKGIKAAAISQEKLLFFLPI